jgi:hypothetical protein
LYALGLQSLDLAGNTSVVFAQEVELAVNVRESGLGCFLVHFPPNAFFSASSSLIARLMNALDW